MALDPKWTATIDDAISNTSWDDHDKTIKDEIDEYNQRFASTPGYAAVDMKLAKAMVWTESGGPSAAAWSKRAMQIGNPGDKGYAIVKGGKEHSNIIMSSALWTELKTKSINDPKLNIRAGIAYLFTRLAKFSFISVDDAFYSFLQTCELLNMMPIPLVNVFCENMPPATEQETTIVSGDSLEKIAKREGTTVEVLKKLNPSASGTLKIGGKLKFHKASMQWVISGWNAFTTANAALKYNGGGDPDYGLKLDYCLDTMKKLKRP